MEVVCPVDVKCAAEISALLQPTNPHQLQDYFHELVKRSGSSIYVMQNGRFGKGVHADIDFQKGEPVLKDEMLVGVQHASNKMDCLVCSFCFRFIGSVELQIGRRLYFQSFGSNGNQTFGECSKAMSDEGEKHDHSDDDGSEEDGFQRRPTFPVEFAQSLINGTFSLPYSAKFPLPSPVPCSRGCAEAYYCSELCAKQDWNASHSLLCTGEESRREALYNFMQHANETNDIFHLAAKAISSTILLYRKLKYAHPDENLFSLLLEAWKPFSCGYKKRWWECISLPDDIESSEESSFRMDVKALAFSSLKLLKAAIFDQECEPLFSLQVYGSIIGMFELNNLDLVVASPVQDYFLFIDELPPKEKEETEKVTRAIYEALEDYTVGCEGTAFYPLQSCMNHSCCPNAKAFKREEDRDGRAIIVSLEPILKGQEITISYIDEDLPLKERQASLADYGFQCKCEKCLP